MASLQKPSADPRLAFSSPVTLSSPHGKPLSFNDLQAAAQSLSTKLEEKSLAGKRLIVVANRLPVSLKKNPNTGEWVSRMSSGGLARAMMGVKGLEMVWIGWPGVSVDKEEQSKVQKIIGAQGCKGVFLTEEQIERYYNGYSNNVLWPLFHYLQLPIEDTFETYPENFKSYEEANGVFADAVMDAYQPGDLVWVHDYHLMLLPAMLRRRCRRMLIGWFLHTPFPSSELYRALPHREKILTGVLSADLVGFHTYDYARHFKSACTKVLGLEVSHHGVQNFAHFSYVGTFPIGIDAQKFLDALETTEAQKHYKELSIKFAGKKVFLGIDRLDYVKGIPHKLYALERFLDKNPHWRGKVVLVQIAVPSREDVPMYQRLRRQTHELVGQINGKYGNIDSVPIHYLDQSVDFHRMCALYRLADLALVTSLRDGMNLVSYEYIACQNEKPAPGVLILSEFAGAAQSLGAGAIRVNPWDIDGIADAIQTAMDLSAEECRELHTYAFNHVRHHTASSWAHSFVHELSSVVAPLSNPSLPPPLNMGHVSESFLSSKKRLIIVGLVGTLTRRRVKGMTYRMFGRVAKVDPKIVEQLKRLHQDPRNTVVVITSRGMQFADQLIGEAGTWIVAENGYYVRRGGRDKPWETTVKSKDLDMSWLPELSSVLEYFVRRTPRSFVEKQETYLTWFYRDSDPEWARAQANDLMTHLVNNPLCSHGFETVHAQQMVQVRPVGVSKGEAARWCLQAMGADKEPVDFALCLGHFLVKDEDLFLALTQPTATVTRGPRKLSTEVSSPQTGPKSTTIIQSMMPGSSQLPVSAEPQKVAPSQHKAVVSPVAPMVKGDVYTVTVSANKTSQADFSLSSAADVSLLLATLADLTVHK